MKKNLFNIAIINLLHWSMVQGQCVICGNGTADAGESNINCPQDVVQPSTCTSPCGQPAPFDPNVGLRQTWDFVGTTTYSTVGLPAGWSFASAPTSTTAGPLPAADIFGSKAGLVQPNCSGGCTGTNYFCIGNIANLVSSGSRKLGGNFDGRTNVSQNLSYVVLRGSGNPALVSPTFNISGVESFKVQIWLNASETSCGQMNSWGSCVGNQARIDFSANNGSSWTPIVTLTTSSSNVDMCTNATSNTFWLQEGTWSRVCLTVFRSSTSPGNFYSFASANTGPAGILVNSTFFTTQFKFRVVYLMSASCNNVTSTNPGRYLAVDYPVFTSGNQTIPCGISFINMCGYGADNNDEGVGSNTSFSTATAFGSVRRGVNNAERGVEIFHAQNVSFQSSNNTSGSSLVTNYDLCNSEGGDAVCMNWANDNNNYFVVYECLTDFEPSSGGVNLQYYKGSTPYSFSLTKVTSAGKTPTIGWRWSGFRFINCSSSADLAPGCTGYSFTTSSLPLQFIRSFYGLSITSTGYTYAYYGPNSCTHYFNGPFISPLTRVTAHASYPNYIGCNGTNAVFVGISSSCLNGSAFSGTPTISVHGPNNPSLLFETISSGVLGTNPIITPGDYYITANLPSSPVQCLNCNRTECITITAADIAALNCNPMPLQFIYWKAERKDNALYFRWKVTGDDISYFQLYGGKAPLHLEPIQVIPADGIFEQELSLPDSPFAYFQLQAITPNGNAYFSEMAFVAPEIQNIQFTETANEILIKNPSQILLNLQIYSLEGKVVTSIHSDEPALRIPKNELPAGFYLLEITEPNANKSIKKIQIH